MTDRITFRLDHTKTRHPALVVWVNGGKAGELRFDKQQHHNALIRLTAAVDDTGLVHDNGERTNYIVATLEVLGEHTHVEFRIENSILGTLVFRNEEQEAIERVCRACDCIKKTEKI